MTLSNLTVVLISNSDFNAQRYARQEKSDLKFKNYMINNLGIDKR